MNKLVSVLLMSLAMGAAYAQDTNGGVTMSTDPAKAAAVESRAQELKAEQARTTKSKPATTHKSSAKAHSNGKSHASAKSHATHKSSTSKSSKSTKS